MRTTTALVGLAFALLAPGATAHRDAVESHLIFASNRDGATHAYAIDPYGRRFAALTVGRQEDRELVVSRDGRHIAFRRTEHGHDLIYVADGAGRHLARVGEGDPAGWSPDGSRLAFFSRGGSSREPMGLAVVDGNGKAKQTLVGGGGSFTEFEGWAPDGHELAYTIEAVQPATGDTATELRTVDLSGTQRLLWSQTGEIWYSASWAPDGRRLAYRRFANGQSEIAVADADSGSTTVVASGDSFGPPVWSPDGTKLLYSRTGAATGSLDVVDLAAGTDSKLTSTAAIEYEPTAAWAWSPAGDRILWSDASGMYVADAAGADRRRLVDATWIGPPAHGVWSPDGGEVAFASNGLHTIRADGTDPRLLAARGSIQLVAWLGGAVPPGARKAPHLPALERSSRRLLRLRGRVRELVAAGGTAGVVSARSRLDCVHVVAWSPRARAVARAARPVPCDPVLPAHWSLVGGLDIDGVTLSWSSDWSCGNTECDRVAYEGVLRHPGTLAVDSRFLSVPYDGPPPKLPCVVCPEPNPTRGNPDVVAGRARVYVRRDVVVVHVHGAPERVLRPPGIGPVYARLTRVGLFYAYSLAGGAYPGRVRFVPLGELG
jgi:Tol biopolymer transport system component